MGVWITCLSPAPREIVLCKTKQMCPGLAPSEGAAPAAARSPTRGARTKPSAALAGAGQSRAAAREGSPGAPCPRSSSPAPCPPAPPGRGCSASSVPAPRSLRRGHVQAELSLLGSWDRGWGGHAGHSPTSFPRGNFSAHSQRHWEALQVLSLSPGRRGQPGIAALLSLRLSRDTPLCNRRFRHATHLPAQPHAAARSSRHRNSPGGRPRTPGWPRRASTPDLLRQPSRPGFHKPRGRQSTAAPLPGARPHARPGLRARAGDGPGAAGCTAPEPSQRE